jgi:phage terminase large subunit-like protein
MMNILTVIADFFPEFAHESRAAWRALLAAIFALRLSAAELEIYRRHTERSQAPTAQAREAWLVIGRRGGKSSAVALIAIYLTCFRKYELSRGERGVFMIIAADRKQARVVKRYVSGLLHSVPMLSALVAHETQDAITLTNGLTIEIHTASFRTIRGYTIVGAVCDEIAFWPNEESANPDTEILNALRPAMATVPGAMLLVISSPYSRRALPDLREALRKRDRRRAGVAGRNESHESHRAAGLHRSRV